MPCGNVPPDQAADFIERAVADLPAAAAQLGQVADDLAAGLREAHIRGSRGQQASAPAARSPSGRKPADVLGIYVYLPAMTGGAR